MRTNPEWWFEGFNGGAMVVISYRKLAYDDDDDDDRRKIRGNLQLWEIIFTCHKQIVDGINIYLRYLCNNKNVYTIENPSVFYFISNDPCKSSLPAKSQW